MIERPDWTARIEKGWIQRPVIWLSGVRRSGKTMFSQALPQVEFLDCARPSDLPVIAAHHESTGKERDSETGLVTAPGMRLGGRADQFFCGRTPFLRRRLQSGSRDTG